MSEGSASKYRRLITLEGSAILRDAFNQGMTRPTREQKEKILQRIHAVPGCENYTLSKVNSWFAEWRHRMGITEPRKSTSSTKGVYKVVYCASSWLDIRTATLRSDQITMLKILYEGTNGDPRQQLIDTWAKLLQASSADVTAWVRAEQDKKETDEQECPRRELLLAIHHELNGWDAVGDRNPPKSAEDFTEMFGPYEKMMKALLNNI
ncbi:hypothetical protein WG66_005287 [Moniliophthora roreri]|uniref:Homeobox domain-containing protein n=1 Tax=Moniliophthora roreri TaxID=221103 RepID=A0A0W0FG85_MONRR|nr:hypothetical protein WG66_005287 [Moniliophthora roreri]